MTDQNIYQPQTEPGQVSPEPTKVGAEGGQDALLAAIDKRLADMEERLARKVQGTTDKADARFREQVQKELDDFNHRVSVLKEAGVNVTPAEIEQGQREIRQAAMSARAQEEPAPAPSGTLDPAKVEKVNADMQHVIEEYGILLKPTDPEAKDLDPAKYADPELYYAEWKKRVDQKAFRLGIITKAPEVSIPMGGGGALGAANPIADIKDPRELIKRGLENL